MLMVFMMLYIRLEIVFCYVKVANCELKTSLYVVIC